MSTDRIEKKVLLRAPLARVWRAISDAREFGLWFGVELDGPFEAGARRKARLVPTTADDAVAAMQKPYEGLEFDIVVERVEPMRHLAFRWHPGPPDDSTDHSQDPMTLVSFALEEAPVGVLLTITETGFDQIPLERRAAAFVGNEEGWRIQTELIEKYLLVHLVG